MSAVSHWSRSTAMGSRWTIHKGELLEHHEKDFLWLDTRRDARLCVENSAPPTTVIAEASSTLSNSPLQVILSDTQLLI